MHKPQQQVRQMHLEVLNQATSPAEPMIRHGELRANLIAEEAIEAVLALVGMERGFVLVKTMLEKVMIESEQSDWNGQPNLVRAIDGCTDVLVVTYGTFEDIGVDAEPFFDEVQRSNMAKKGGPMREDGKQLKPPGWTPPNLQGVLDDIVTEQKWLKDARR